MSSKLLVSILLAFSLSQCRGQQSSPSCSVEIYTQSLKTALNNLGDGSFAPPTANGIDALFAALRSDQEAELVIMLDTSLEVRPNRFNLVLKPLIDALLRYHINPEKVSVTLMTFGEGKMEVQCREVVGRCDEIYRCVVSAAYERTSNQNGWIGTTLVNAMDEAYTIFNQSSKARRQKIILVVSGFRITASFRQELDDKKKDLAGLGATVYSVLSSFRERSADARRVATSAAQAANDESFVAKLYGIMPLGDRSCAGIITAAPAGDNKNVVCKNGPGGEMCMCKLGYQGSNCEMMPAYCSVQSACPLGSRCILGDYLKYTCECPECNGPEVCMNFRQVSQPAPLQPPIVPPPAPRPAPRPAPPPASQVPVPQPRPPPREGQREGNAPVPREGEQPTLPREGQSPVPAPVPQPPREGRSPLVTPTQRPREGPPPTASPPRPVPSSDERPLITFPPPPPVIDRPVIDPPVFPPSPVIDRPVIDRPVIDPPVVLPPAPPPSPCFCIGRSGELPPLDEVLRLVTALYERANVCRPSNPFGNVEEFEGIQTVQ